MEPEEGEAEAPTTSAEPGLLESSVEEMMYGFGDVWPPNREAVQFAEAAVVQYIRDLARGALGVAELKGKLDVGCFQFLVRKDPVKYRRVQDILKAMDEINKVKNAEIKDEFV
jgi:hypothetical protein